jgi:hypothetical protein
MRVNLGTWEFGDDERRLIAAYNDDAEGKRTRGRRKATRKECAEAVASAYDLYWHMMGERMEQIARRGRDDEDELDEELEDDLEDGDGWGDE